jgi:anti-sigma28 factor (negative regulator of flagellin synthesis)
MKINPIVNPNVLRSYQVTKTGMDKTNAVSKRDEVTLSSEALSFSKALTEARNEIEFRTPEELSHIAGIKDQVSRGQYHVESSLIAARIIEDLTI